jgi:uncharacterized membrane protein YeaQ/YmgE (transglycosylase-associated protein family)
VRTYRAGCAVDFSKIIVWLIIGALAGRLVTFSKQGLGFWTNLGLGEIKITFEDLISAFVGSLLCVGAWWLIRKRTASANRRFEFEKRS